MNLGLEAPFADHPWLLKASMGRKSREKKLRAQMRQSGAAPVAVTIPPPGAPKKMSEILLDVAEPLLAGLKLPEDEGVFRSTLIFAAALWNASAYPTEAERQEAIAEFTRLADLSIAPGEELLLGQIMKRARARHPREERLITSMQLVVGSDGGYRLDVRSAGGE